MKRVLLVGGGTAGHVEPALAVGKWLVAHDSQIQVAFLGTRSGIEVDLLLKEDFPLHCITKVPLPRKINSELFTFPFRLIYSLAQSLRIIRNFDLIIGFGGYVSASAYLAARALNKPIVIHEANALPGWSNKLGARFATEIAVAVDSVKRSYPAWSNAIFTGMPIRREISKVADLSKDQKRVIKNRVISELGLNPQLPIIFAFGGSQGSAAINKTIIDFSQSEAGKSVQIIHAVGGKNSLPSTEANYRPFSYIYNMAEMYVACDLVISRSGAVSCAEIEAIHKFAVLVPLPIGNGEQSANAHDLVNSGAALICNNSEFTSSWLERNLESLIVQATKFNNAQISAPWQNADEAIGNIALSIMER